MIKQEISKVKIDRQKVVKRLDELSSKPIRPDQAEEFNQLCRQEMVLSMKERLLNRKDGDPILPPRIQRTITFAPIISSPPKKTS